MMHSPCDLGSLDGVDGEQSTRGSTASGRGCVRIMPTCIVGVTGAAALLALPAAATRSMLEAYRKAYALQRAYATHQMTHMQRLWAQRALVTDSSSTDSWASRSTTLSRTEGRRQRSAIKLRALAYYGLTNPADAGQPFDMFGAATDSDDVTLAHIIPRCYGGDLLPGDMVLPADCLTRERGFLLLPRDVHTWFDNGVVGFVPKPDCIVVRVFNPRHLKFGHAAVASGLDGTPLCIPRGPTDSHWPYTHLLAWFAWVAKTQSAGLSATAFDPELEAGLRATADARGHAAVKRQSDAAADVAKRLNLMTR